MSESGATGSKRVRRIHHTGRQSQIWIYLGKQLRFFINESDWKVLPMAAVIAALVAMVIKRRFFVNMEGSLIGAFALTCVAIWNGCFNSIQSVCRERAIIKREHRSGMHISSYMIAHMIYQLMLCAAQTVLTMFVLRQLGVPIPKGFGSGFMTPWMILDIGISMFLISFAADMMSLFLSSISRTTTGAMTLMPFVLIFQLVFSGGIIPLPAWSQPLSNFTISNYGIRAMASQSGYNELPMTTVWNTVSGMKNTEVGTTFTVGQILDLLDKPGLEKYRDTELIRSYTFGDASMMLQSADKALHLRDRIISRPFTLREVAEAVLREDALKNLREFQLIKAKGDYALTVGEVLQALIESPAMADILDSPIGKTITVGQVADALHIDEVLQSSPNQKLNNPVTAGMVLDFLKNNDFVQSHRDRSFTLKVKVGDIIDAFGEENVKNFVQKKTAEAAHKDIYNKDEKNIASNWFMLLTFAFFFALIATIALEMIDKDKR